MNVSAPEAFLVTTFAVTVVAAAFDWRTKRIPNTLTLGGLLLAFPLHAWFSPTTIGLESAALGMLACGVPAVVGWYLGWVAGGDVKLMSAMGALGGLSFGVEAVFLSLFCACSFIVLRLCWDGTLLRSSREGLTVAVSRTLLRSKRIGAPDKFTMSLRFGPFALAGAGLSLFLHGAVL